MIAGGEEELVLEYWACQGAAEVNRVERLTVGGFVSRLHAVLQSGVVERILGDVGNDVDDLGTHSGGNTATVGLQLYRRCGHFHPGGSRADSQSGRNPRGLRW